MSFEIVTQKLLIMYVYDIPFSSKVRIKIHFMLFMRNLNMN